MEDKKVLMWDMPFKLVLRLDKSHKMVAIKSLIQSMIEDREHEIIAYYETESGKDE